MEVEQRSRTKQPREINAETGNPEPAEYSALSFCRKTSKSIVHYLGPSLRWE